MILLEDLMKEFKGLQSLKYNDKQNFRRQGIRCVLPFQITLRQLYYVRHAICPSER